MYVSTPHPYKDKLLLIGIVLILALILGVSYVWYGLIQDRALQESLQHETPMAGDEASEEVPVAVVTDPMTAKLLQPATAPEIVNSPSAAMRAKLEQPMDRSILRQE